MAGGVKGAMARAVGGAGEVAGGGAARGGEPEAVPRPDADRTGLAVWIVVAALEGGQLLGAIGIHIRRLEGRQRPGGGRAGPELFESPLSPADQDEVAGGSRPVGG